VRFDTEYRRGEEIVTVPCVFGEGDRGVLAYVVVVYDCVFAWVKYGDGDTDATSAILAYRGGERDFCIGGQTRSGPSTLRGLDLEVERDLEVDFRGRCGSSFGTSRYVDV